MRWESINYILIPDAKYKYIYINDTIYRVGGATLQESDWGSNACVVSMAREMVRKRAPGET